MGMRIMHGEEGNQLLRSPTLASDASGDYHYGTIKEKTSNFLKGKFSIGHRYFLLFAKTHCLIVFFQNARYRQKWKVRHIS
jgi:hypothetical protein